MDWVSIEQKGNTIKRKSDHCIRFCIILSYIDLVSILKKDKILGYLFPFQVRYQGHRLMHLVISMTLLLQRLKAIRILVMPINTLSPTPLPTSGTLSYPLFLFSLLSFSFSISSLSISLSLSLSLSISLSLSHSPLYLFSLALSLCLFSLALSLTVSSLLALLALFSLTPLSSFLTVSILK